jgi:hypothetical protein
MPEGKSDTTDHSWLRLSPEDVALLWGVVDGQLLKATERWPRLERIKFDLDVMMAKQEMANG